MEDMTQTHDWESTPASDIEGKFLQLLEAKGTPPSALAPGLICACRKLGKTAADGMAEMLCEALTSRGDKAGVVVTLSVWAAWREDAEFARFCFERLTQLAGKERLFTAFVKACGLADGATASEGLRRLAVLMDLKPGALCLEGTWGFGVVKRIDDFYAKVTIDFDRKRAHEMTFGYAAQTLRLLTPDHLFARRHHDAAGVRRMASENPAELVRLALSSLGPMTITRLQEVLSEGIVSAAEWKDFWANARKSLKDDARVEIPAKRTEPIRLHENVKSYGDAWFMALAGERIRESILDRLLELETAVGAEALTDAQRAVVGDRLAFALRGAESADSAMAARLLMAAERFGIRPGLVDLDVWAPRLAQPVLLTDILIRLPARDLDAWLRTLASHARGALPASLGSILTELPPSALDAVWTGLEAMGETDDALRLLRRVSGERRPGPMLACWLARRAEWTMAQDIADAAGLFGLALEALEPVGAGERLKAQKQLRETLMDVRWLQTLMDRLEPRARQHLLKRIEVSEAWDPTSRRSVMARMIKLYPDLTTTDDEPAPEGQVRLTSWRSLRERQEQYRKLIEEDIPANSRDIGVARSYGDLRENFEYTAAKDQQRLLLRRQAEIEADLKLMKGTNFQNAQTDAAGMGVEVEVEFDGGVVDVYRILGEWDRDEALRIVSSRSLLAERLSGLRVGETAALPTAGGPDRSCRIAAIGPLPKDVLDWAQ
jgi:transcription elongation GreA/GreB family factor